MLFESFAEMSDSIIVKQSDISVSVPASPVCRARAAIESASEGESEQKSECHKRRNCSRRLVARPPPPPPLSLLLAADAAVAVGAAEV